jgi:hypothetical protein
VLASTSAVQQDRRRSNRPLGALSQLQLATTATGTEWGTLRLAIGRRLPAVLIGRRLQQDNRTGKKNEFCYRSAR